MHRASLVFLVALCLTTPAAAAAPTGDFKPDPRSVRRHGPAYRYPQAGWIVLHIEGEPYERGYQHGWLLAPEIVGYVKCFASLQNSKAPADGWKTVRTLANALFVRRFDDEYLKEMKGIADGASAAGAKFDDRPVDLVDIVAINCWAEIETLDAALEATPTGLEGIRFPRRRPQNMPAPKPMHCSAFAATGPATADGKIVFGHVTMFDLYPSLFYNVWLDLKPAKGHRVLMQTYPGGIQSGMDYYMNDAGVLVLETTIAQTRFDPKGLSLSSRIRKALQYADNIDKAVELLQKDNNGLYTNEWLLADVKTNEIAMFELGTTKSKLYRSSKGEWFGGTEGFYWGCNNTKDLEVRLDTIASINDKPANMVWKPADRDKKWLQLYARYKGKIDADFGKTAFTTTPLCSAITIDAKYTTTDLAKQLKSWVMFGPPLGKSWQPTDDEKQRFSDIRPLVSNPWALVHAQAPAKEEAKGLTVADLPDKIEDVSSGDKDDKKQSMLRTEDRSPPTVPAWHGTLLPKTDGDIWLATAFADYQKIVALENALEEKDGKLSQDECDKLAVELYAHRSNYLAASRIRADVPLAKIRSEITRDDWYRIASGKGVLLLHELRKAVGNKTFQDTMDSFGRAHAGKEVSGADFQAYFTKIAGKKVDGFFESWLTQPGLRTSTTGGGVYSVLSFKEEPEDTLIVYGTLDEEAANKETAEALQEGVRANWCNCTVTVRADKEVKDDDLKNRHLLLIGRPDCNAIVARFQGALPITFGSRSFVVRKDAFAHPGSGVIVAAESPLNKRFSIVVLAGLSAEATTKLPAVLNKKDQSAAEAFVAPNGGKPKALVLSAKDLIREVAGK
jgi:hypothetical protein